MKRQNFTEENLQRYYICVMLDEILLKSIGRLTK